MTFAQPFSNYEILARIGSGAMGTVFKARQKHMNRIVALKVLKPSLARDSRFVERLQREARIVGKLNHPNVVTGYDLGHEGGYHFFVMEFVEGRSLRQLLAEWGMFPEEQVLDVAIQVADALAHAFECGVIHRDIKPGNILIDAEGRVKLTDMGLAKVETDLQLTREGATVGTPQYISPEQARDPRSADVRSDLYSLGATLFHMATGQLPYKADTIGELITKVLQERPPSAIELNPALSDGLSLVIRKLLAKDPGLRYQTPRDLLNDLARVRRRERPTVDRGTLAQDHAVEASRPATRPTPGGGRWTYVAIAVLAVTVVGLAIRGAGGEARVQPVDVEAFTRALDARIDAAATLREKFEVVRNARATALDVDGAGDADPVREKLIVAAEERLERALEAEIAAELDAWTGARRATLDAWLGDPAHWRDPGSLMREQMLPGLEARTGFVIHELPTAASQRAAAERVGRLSAAVAAMAEQRDAEFLRRHERYLREELTEQVLEIARNGDERAALAQLRAGLDGFFEVAGHPARDELPDAVAARVAEAEDGVERSVEADLRDARRAAMRALRAESDAGFATIGRLRDEILQRGGSPAPLRSAIEELSQRLGDLRVTSARAVAGAEDPWPEIEAQLRAAAGEADVLRQRFDAEVLAEVLDLGYRILIEAGPAAAAHAVGACAPATPAVAAERDRHVELLARAARVVAVLVGPSTGGRLPSTAGRVVRISAASATDGLRGEDGARVPTGAIDWLRAIDALPRAVRESVATDLDGARAVLGLCQGEHAAAVGGLDAVELPFVEEKVWPRLRAARAEPGSDTGAAARSVMQSILRARDAGDVELVRQQLDAFDARYADTPEGSDTLRVRSDLREWLRIRDHLLELESTARTRFPPDFAVEVATTGAVRVEGRAASLLPSMQPAGGWVIAVPAGGADGSIRSSPEGEARPFVIPLPLDRPQAVRVVCEVRFEDRGSAAQAVGLQIGDVACIVVVMPLGHVAAAILEGPDVIGRPDDLQRTLAAPIAEAVGSAPRAVLGAWHRISIEAVRRRGGGADVIVRWDGRDGPPLLEGRGAWRAIPTQVVVGPVQPLGLRAVAIECVPE